MGTWEKNDPSPHIEGTWLWKRNRPKRVARDGLQYLHVVDMNEVHGSVLFFILPFEVEEEAKVGNGQEVGVMEIIKACMYTCTQCWPFTSLC